jgi:hypothetical protein
MRECGPKGKMLAQSLLKKRVRCAKKSYKPGAATVDRSGGGGQRAVFRAGGVPVFEGVEVDLPVSEQRANRPGAEAAQAARGAKREAGSSRYRRIAALLRQEGWPVGKRHVQRLRRSIGLREPPTKRKVVRPGISKGAADEGRAPGHVWSWDFISDATTRGGALRMLTILDEYPRECHVLRADRALKSSDVLEWDRADHRRARIAHLRAE